MQYSSYCCSVGYAGVTRTLNPLGLADCCHSFAENVTSLPWMGGRRNGSILHVNLFSARAVSIFLRYSCTSVLPSIIFKSTMIGRMSTRSVSSCSARSCRSICVPSQRTATARRVGFDAEGHLLLASAKSQLQIEYSSDDVSLKH